jgi:hypothetical protein
MNQTSSRVKITEVSAELAQNAKPVDPSVRAQVRHARHPMLGHFSRDGLSGLEFGHQELIQVEQDLLAADPTATTPIPRLQKSMES